VRTTQTFAVSQRLQANSTVVLLRSVNHAACSSTQYSSSEHSTLHDSSLRTQIDAAVIFSFALRLDVKRVSFLGPLHSAVSGHKSANWRKLPPKRRAITDATTPRYKPHNSTLVPCVLVLTRSAGSPRAGVETQARPMSRTTVAGRFMVARCVSCWNKMLELTAAQTESVNSASYGPSPQHPTDADTTLRALQATSSQVSLSANFP
jgi:hypothetical protein